MFVIEWLIGLANASFKIVFAILMAIPYHIAWNAVAVKWLYFIPANFQHIKYWECVAMLLAAAFVGEILQHITPTIVNVSSSSSAGRKE